MHVVACQKCGAELPAPDLDAIATCGYCQTSFHLPCAESDTLASSPDYEGTRIPMNDEAVLGLLRQHFGDAESTFLAPTIPGGKELGARALHARHLPSDERVLALYDDSLFGTGDDGFLVTSVRLCWKNAGDRARAIAWQDVDPHRMYADKRRLILGTLAIEITGDGSVIEACEQAFHVLALSARASSLRRSSGIALSRSADSSGVVATSPSGRPGTMPMPTAENTRPSSRPTLRPSHPPTLESAVAPANASGRGRTAMINATPPPPHGVSLDSYVVHAASQRGPSFACWHCHTPLYWNTPQCARCNALPSPQGWLRTG